jgi:Na+/pantothenate symporter
MGFEGIEYKETSVTSIISLLLHHHQLHLSLSIYHSILQSKEKLSLREPFLNPSSCKALLFSLSLLASSLLPSSLVIPINGLSLNTLELAMLQTLPAPIHSVSTRTTAAKSLNAVTRSTVAQQTQLQFPMCNVAPSPLAQAGVINLDQTMASLLMAW